MGEIPLHNDATKKALTGEEVTDEEHTPAKV
jgi:hypothetical protein